MPASAMSARPSANAWPAWRVTAARVGLIWRPGHCR
ncbi:Uncharacterised protein [Bordetella pertussis]|nr:Uncharacterised protein [Bordetella pertussis]